MRFAETAPCARQELPSQQCGVCATSGKLSSQPPSADARSAGNIFVLDPIDGTKGFMKAQQYAVALGMMVDGQVCLPNERVMSALIASWAAVRRYRIEEKIAASVDLSIGSAGGGQPALCLITVEALSSLQVVLGLLGCPNVPQRGFPIDAGVEVGLSQEGGSLLVAAKVRRRRQRESLPSWPLCLPRAAAHRPRLDTRAHSNLRHGLRIHSLQGCGAYQIPLKGKGMEGAIRVTVDQAREANQGRYMESQKASARRGERLRTKSPAP